MDQQPQFPNASPQSTPPNETGIPPMPAGGGQPPLPPQGTGFQQNPEGNESERRAKRRIYTFIQIISVIFLLVSCPLIIVSLLEIGPQFGKTAETTASITEITTDFGGIVDQATGLTDLSSGCRVHYNFAIADKTYEGSVHSTNLCASELGTVVNIVHNPTIPSDNTLAKDWAPYDTYLIVGAILLAGSLISIIIFSIMKRKVPRAPVSSNHR